MRSQQIGRLVNKGERNNGTFKVALGFCRGYALGWNSAFHLFLLGN